MSYWVQSMMEATGVLGLVRAYHLSSYLSSTRLLQYYRILLHNSYNIIYHTNYLIPRQILIRLISENSSNTVSLLYRLLCVGFLVNTHLTIRHTRSDILNMQYLILWKSLLRYMHKDFCHIVEI